MAFFSFDKKSRILKREDYLKIGQKGRRLRTKHFTVLYNKNELGYTRCGITASKKIGNAVIRNRVKRRLREFFRLNKDNLKASTDYVFIAGKGSSHIKYRELSDELLLAFKKSV